MPQEISWRDVMGYSLLWSALGAVLVLLALFDLYATTLTVSGTGPMSKRLGRCVWNTFLAAHRRGAGHGVLTTAGPCAVLTLIVVWLVLCWLGWFLIFCGSEDMVVNATTTLSASPVERLYYAGYSLTTIGYGDFRASGPWSQLLSVVCGFNGLFLITLAITYSIPVVSSSVDKRRLSAVIGAIGRSSSEIVDKSFGSGDFQFLVNQLQQITGEVAAIAEKHLAYPVLLFFHAPARETALPVTLSRLDEALTIISIAFPDTPAQSQAQIKTSQEVIETFMKVLHGNFIPEVDEMPEVPDFMQIHVLKQSPLTRDEIQEHIASLERRRLLLSYVVADGWSWSDVHDAAKP
jgi:hypothetical protein